MKIYSVILNEYMAFEYDNYSTLFQSADLDKAIDFAKTSIYQKVLNHQGVVNMISYYNLANKSGDFFPVSGSYSEQQIYVIETELEVELTPSNKKVVWELNEKLVFDFFSKDLDIIFREDAIPYLSLEEKEEFFAQFKTNTRLFSENNPLYMPNRLNAAYIYAMSSSNQNDIALYERFEARYH